MPLNELQRRAYLDAMGIECLAPRLQLPGARPSTLCEMPEQAVADDAQLTSVQSSEAVPVVKSSDGRSGAADILSLLDTESPARQSKATAKTERAEKPVADKVVPRFALSIVRAGQLLIVDDGPGGESDPQAYLRLLQNIQFALGLPPAALAIEGFRWPMAKARGSHIDQSESVARETLLAYLYKHLEQDQCQQVLLMGESACKYVAGEAVPRGEWLSLASLPVKCMATHSAGQALLDSRLKPLIWKDLQPVMQAVKPH